MLETGLLRRDGSKVSYPVKNKILKTCGASGASSAWVASCATSEVMTRASIGRTNVGFSIIASNYNVSTEIVVAATFVMLMFMSKLLEQEVHFFYLI